MECCPACGELVESLTDLGWCDDCSAPVYRNAASIIEVYLEANADHLEHYMVQGLTLTQAIDKLRVDVRPRCISCGGVISRAPRRNVLICRKTPQCRRVSRRYVYLYTKKGYTKIEALVKIFEELG